MPSKQTRAFTRPRNYPLPVAFLLAALFLASCAPATRAPAVFPSYDPFMPLDGNSPVSIPAASNVPDSPTPTRGPTPARSSFAITLVPTPGPDQPLVTPTPDSGRQLPTPRQDVDQYVVQAGDTLGSIAQRYGISMDALMQMNGISDPNLLEVGVTLDIPAPEPGSVGPSFKIIPNSELVYGPASAFFDINQFIQSREGYLASYAEEVNGEFLPADEIVARVAQNYSVNPRLLLAMLEYQSGWVTNPTPFNVEYPIGLADTYHTGLYLQLTWAADTLNRGYYLWHANAISNWVLTDGAVVPANPTINAGTAGVQHFYSKLDDRTTWEKDLNPEGFFLTYYVLFGNPFHLSVEPLVPPSLAQPRLTLPFTKGETWAFTGGPHGGWDSGSGWAALDFAPPGEVLGCVLSGSWVTAVADGLIVRAKDGAVIQDLDNDGYEQTGWVILYMHVDASERVQPETYLFAGERVGHPSCEGGVSNGTHLHIARKYNGEWIPADGPLPFNLDGWISSGDGVEYDGFLTRGNQVLEAWDGVNELNQITR
ncbi:MAG: LysM peptidoglycan-binding domain-containing protein [Chloroflexi bacterium]|nr:LysM peptidoglycan-binding domain-containing protein [Chloroflexota bacterium]